MARIHNRHGFYSEPRTSDDVLVPLFPSCCDWTRLLIVQPWGLQRLQLKTHFQVSGTFQWRRAFMKMLFWELCWPRHDGRIPWGYLVMDGMKRPKTHATSVTTREGSETGVRGLSFWLGVSHSLTCFLRCLRSEFWKRGALGDLQQFVFNKQWQTTSSPLPPRCSHSPGFYVTQPLNQPPRQSHWTQHGPEEVWVLILASRSCKPGTILLIRLLLIPLNSTQIKRLKNTWSSIILQSWLLRCILTPFGIH